MSSRIGSPSSYKDLSRAVRGQDGCARGSPVRRLRRLQEGDGLPQAGRHRDLRHAAGLPLGPFHLRHREGPERLHGEAGHRGRPDQQADAQARRRGVGQEPQGRRGPDVPPQPGAPGTGQARPGRRDRRHHPAARLPDARPGRVLPLPAQAGRHQRLLLPDPALPQLPLGQRRQLQRLLHPHHRPPGLDEERLAGQGAGAGRPPLSPESRRRHLRGPELRHLRGRIHLRRRHQVQFRRPLHERLPGHLRELPPRQQGLAIASKSGDCGLPSSIYKGQDRDACEHDLGIQDQPRTSGTRIRTSGTT